jgi:hypothetical protein
MSPDAGATNSFRKARNKDPRRKLGIFPNKIVFESSFASMLYGTAPQSHPFGPAANAAKKIFSFLA